MQIKQKIYSIIEGKRENTLLMLNEEYNDLNTGAVRARLIIHLKHWRILGPKESIGGFSPPTLTD
jgi:hypothetical protein